MVDPVELGNALTVLPSLATAVTHTWLWRKHACKSRLWVTRTLMSFVLVCCTSIAFHLVDGRRRPRLKAMMLRADYSVQQLAAALHAVAEYSLPPKQLQQQQPPKHAMSRTVVRLLPHVVTTASPRFAAAAVLAFSSATAVFFDVTRRSDEIPILALHSAAIAVAIRGDVSGWWLLIITSRLASSASSVCSGCRYAHWLFHAATPFAMHDIWSSWRAL